MTTFMTSRGYLHHGHCYARRGESTPQRPIGQGRNRRRRRDYPPWPAGRSHDCGETTQTAGSITGCVSSRDAAPAKTERGSLARGAGRGTLMLYFDTSFLVPLILAEQTTEKIERFLTAQTAGELAVSCWTRLEFSSLLEREVRVGGLQPGAALDADAQFEALVNDSFVVL